jgi:hypothetical protein
MLVSAEGIAALPPRQRRERIRAIEKQRGVFARTCCSTSWAQDLFHGSPQPQYPPGGSTTRMILCRDCGRYTPIGACDGQSICYDCWLAAQSEWFLACLPSSPGVIDMARLAKNARTPRRA